jgi:hypothetical protein
MPDAASLWNISSIPYCYGCPPNNIPMRKLQGSRSGAAKVQSLWDVTLHNCSGCFEGTYCLHVQGQAIEDDRLRHTIVQNMSNYWPNDTVSYPRRLQLSILHYAYWLQGLGLRNNIYKKDMNICNTAILSLYDWQCGWDLVTCSSRSRGDLRQVWPSCTPTWILTVAHLSQVCMVICQWQWGERGGTFMDLQSSWKHYPLRGTNNLTPCWYKCTECQGDYFKKSVYLFSSAVI